MEYTEGITINGLHSFRDYGLHISARKIDLPPKNSIRKTVPFMNGFYDFTNLNGGASWGERIISYTFDIAGFTVEEMDRKRTEIVNAYCNLHNVDIYDDTIPDYHFHGSYESSSQNEDGEKSELTIEFVCQPFMIENVPTEAIVYNGVATLRNQGQAVRPYATTAQNGALRIGGLVQTIQTGQEFDLALVLQNGDNEVEITKANELVYPFNEKTHTENGITFTVNEDGTIIADGTASDVAWCYLRGGAESFKPPEGNHRLSGCPAGGSGNTYRIQAYAYHGESESPVYSYDNGQGGIIQVNENTQYLSIAIRIAKGATVNKLEFKPALYGGTVIKWRAEVL